VQNDSIALLDDTGERPLGQARPGEVAVLSNGRVAVDCAHTRVSAEGTRLDITWRLRFDETLLGLIKAYAYAGDVDGASSTWRRIQGLDITAGAYRVTPYHSSRHPGQFQTFEFAYQHQGDLQDIAQVEWMLRDSTSTDIALQGAYDIDQDAFLLFDGSGNVAASGSPGEPRTMENDLAVVDLSLCETQPLSDTLMVRWHVALKGTMSGKHHTLQMRSLLKNPQPARWAMVGDCLVNRAPTWGEVEPREATIRASEWITVETTFVDPDGWQHIHDGLLLINEGLAGEAGFAEVALVAHEEVTPVIVGEHDHLGALGVSAHVLNDQLVGQVVALADPVEPTFLLGLYEVTPRGAEVRVLPDVLRRRPLQVEGRLGVAHDATGVVEVPVGEHHVGDRRRREAQLIEQLVGGAIVTDAVARHVGAIDEAGVDEDASLIGEHEVEHPGEGHHRAMARIGQGSGCRVVAHPVLDAEDPGAVVGRQLG